MFRMIFLTFHGEPRAPDIHARIVESRRVMIAPLVVLALLSLWIPFGANPFDPDSGWFLGSWISAPRNIAPIAAQPRVDEQFLSLPLPPGVDEMVVDREGPIFQSAIEHETERLHHTFIPGWLSLPAAMSLLIAGLGIVAAFLRYGRASARGQRVSWESPRGVRGFLFNRWYQDNLYEKIFPVGFIVVSMKMMAWLDQNVIDGVVNGVGSFTVGLARVAGGFDTYVVDGLVNMIAGTTQFLGLVFRQLQTGRIQTYVVYVVLGVVVLFFIFI